MRLCNQGVYIISRTKTQFENAKQVELFQWPENISRIFINAFFLCIIMCFRKKPTVEYEPGSDLSFLLTDAQWSVKWKQDEEHKVFNVSGWNRIKILRKHLMCLSSKVNLVFFFFSNLCKNLNKLKQKLTIKSVKYKFLPIYTWWCDLNAIFVYTFVKGCLV